MPSNKDLIQKLWQFPVLRPQIPNLIDSARKKFFALRDATDRAEEKWVDYQSEYERLVRESQSVNRKV
jgi:hypothetical protein